VPNQLNLEIILVAALEIPGLQERAAYLDEACGGDLALREEVGSLIAAHLAAETFMNTAADPLWREVRSEKEGDTIDRYKLLRQIGEGGFGTVYLAEQSEPVKRQVALKIIKPGMDSREIIARFEAERQVLALMDHPHIAKVHDAGTTEGGRPYFVMELVKGVPITNYCAESNLDTRQRLELFTDVCAAVLFPQNPNCRMNAKDNSPSRVFLFAALCAVGLVSGAAGNRFVQARGLAHPGSDFASGPQTAVAESPAPAMAAPASGAVPRSEDTEESLLALPARELFGRLALWLLDADEAGIAGFRQRYVQQGGQDGEIIRLIFVNWTRLNPQGAINSAASDEDRYNVWHAWASHDPEAALTADAAAGGGMSGATCSAIGEFHPAWLLAHYNRLRHRCRACLHARGGAWLATHRQTARARGKPLCS